MNYDLAKQLRDAGFPQGGNGKWIGPPDKIVWRSGDRAYAPTLEELIAACGTEFRDFELLEHTQPARLPGTGATPIDLNLLTDAVGSICETVARAQPDGYALNEAPSNAVNDYDSQNGQN